MLNFRLLAIAGIVLLCFGTAAHAQQPISPFFYGLSMSGAEIGAEPWPVDNFTGARLWDAGEVAWSEINPYPGFYDWRELDIWMNHAKEYSIDLDYCIGRTPTWASSEPQRYRMRERAGFLRLTG
jgi:hypothetical protein